MGTGHGERMITQPKYKATNSKDSSDRLELGVWYRVVCKLEPRKDTVAEFKHRQEGLEAAQCSRN